MAILASSLNYRLKNKVVVALPTMPEQSLLITGSGRRSQGKLVTYVSLPVVRRFQTFTPNFS
jgi:hypothetical protein